MSVSRNRLPRTVLVLGAVSFLNDIASEMIMPLLPVFLVTALGAGPAVLGLIEGVADATASIMKLGIGILADQKGKWKRFIRAGYMISNAARPIIGLASSWSSVLGLRFADRVGKGIRTAPRDAMIAAAVSDEIRGKAFGYHRAMDHAGASIGPVVAFLLLAGGWTIRDVILVSVVPGIGVVCLVMFGLKGIDVSRVNLQKRFGWAKLGPEFRRLLFAAGGVSFAAIPDVLLIYWAFGKGISVSLIPLLWAAAHVGRTLSSMIFGSISDRRGRFQTTVTGWLLRIVLLLVLAFTQLTLVWVWPIFIAFTAVTASTEAVERAWISGLAPESLRASFFGAYHMITGLAVLPGAILVGLVWESLGAQSAFLLSAALTAAFATSLVWAAGRVKTSDVES